MTDVVDLFTGSGGVGAVAGAVVLIAGWWVRHRLDLVEAAMLSGDPAAAGRLRVCCDLVTGGRPCQPFSNTGIREKLANPTRPGH
jgi:site-specific DNA-cytosine methylase